MTEQSNAAAERSAHVERDHGSATERDQRPGFWVVLKDAKGQLLRYWFSRMETIPWGARLEITTIEPKVKETPR